MKAKADYDFTQGVRGKYTKAYQKSVHVLKLDDNVDAVFSNVKLTMGTH